MTIIKEAKAFILTLLSVAIVGGVVSAVTPHAEAKHKEPIGYAIVEHYDGDEHIDVDGYIKDDGVLIVYATDGRTIISNDITIILN